MVGFPGGSEVKASACDVGHPGSIPGSGRFPGEGNGNPLQYSCLENPMDGGAWWATVHGVAKRQDWAASLSLSLSWAYGTNFKKHKKGILWGGLLILPALSFPHREHLLMPVLDVSSWWHPTHVRGRGVCACVHLRAYVEQAFTTNGSMPLHSCNLNCHLTVYLGNRYTYFCGSESCSVVSDPLWPHGLHSPWNSPGQNTGVGSLSLLLGIFPIQGSNPSLPHCRRILYQLSHQENPRMLEWVTYPFSIGSSRPRNQAPVLQADGFFTIREGYYISKPIDQSHFLFIWLHGS